MTRQEIESAAPDPGPHGRSVARLATMLHSEGGHLLARDALATLPADTFDLAADELTPLPACNSDVISGEQLKAPPSATNTHTDQNGPKGEKSGSHVTLGKKQTTQENKGRQPKRGTIDTKDNPSQDARLNVTRAIGNSLKERNETIISGSVINRLAEVTAAKKGKLQNNETSSALNNARRKDTNNFSPSYERKKIDKMESFIGENIAGNNAGYYPSEDAISIQYMGTYDGPKMSSTGAFSPCVNCGEDYPTTSGGICKQCMHRSRQMDGKGGRLDELIAYAHSLARSVKKMLSIKGTLDSEDGEIDKTDYLELAQEMGVPAKLQENQSELTRHKYQSDMTATSVCGDDIETMSAIDGEASKDSRLQRQASSVTSSDTRPPLARAKTKVKALFSSSRTKTFRSHVSRTRVGQDFKNDSLTLVADGKRGGFSDSGRKSGRTQTFDSSNLHGRKDVLSRSKMEVMQEGTPVDPPEDYKTVEKTHKYAISRSATSPGTNVPGLNKLQRQKSNYGSGMTLMRTNTKLTLRANKAAALRMGSTQKATILFHQQPAVDEGEVSPVMARKVSVSPEGQEDKTTGQVTGSTPNKRNSGDASLSVVDAPTGDKREDPAISEGLNEQQETRLAMSTVQQTSQETESEIYCGSNSYNATQDDHVDREMSIVLKERKTDEMPEKNPYCDGLRHLGKGLEDQLMLPPVVEEQSAVLLTPYFDKLGRKQDGGGKRRDAGPEVELSLYTVTPVKGQSHNGKPKERGSVHRYGLHGVMSKSSTQLRESTTVRSSLSDVTTHSSRTGIAGWHTRKQVNYSETDVDSGTIYHMTKRIEHNHRGSSQSKLIGNFFEIGGDVSKSSSSTSGQSSVADEAVYTGGFLRDTFDDSDKKDVSESTSSVSDDTYFNYEGSFKPEVIECDIYTGSVFSPSANNLALTGNNFNWRDMSTNNSNRLPSYCCRCRTTMAHVVNRRILNCSNNSSSSLGRSRSPSSSSQGPTVTKTTTSSYIDYNGYRRQVNQPVTICLPETIDFTKYDNIGMDDTGFFFSSPSSKRDKDSVYEGHIFGFRDAQRAYPGEPSLCSNKPMTDDLYTPGDRNTNVNNNDNPESGDNWNNNYFGDFYTDNESSAWSSSQDRRPSNQASTSSGDFTSQRSPKYTPGSFYENAYAEPQASPPPAQANSSVFGMFTGYGEPPATHGGQYSPEYAGAFPRNSVSERQRRTPGSNLYERYERHTSSSPKRQSYEQDGYFDYHYPGSHEDKLENQETSGRSAAPVVPKIKRVGAIICRENVVNKDDYAEDVNRDMMEDPWIPISYRLAAEQVKEMGGGRCSSKDLFKSSERCEPSLMDGSPFNQGQMLEALGRKASPWNLKQDTGSLKEDISMKWRDAREKNSRQQQPRAKKSSLEVPAKTSSTSVWRPIDHIPAKARGNRTLIKSEPRGPTMLDKDGANTNNSRVWSAVMWVPSTVGSYVKKLW